MDDDNRDDKGSKTWSEEILVAGGELVKKVKELIEKGNVRKIIIKKEDGSVLFEIPLTTGVAVGGALALFAPVLVAIGAVAGLLSHVRVEIIHNDDNNEDKE